MERLPRLATRMVKCMRELPYKERLRRLNLYSLERRRLRRDLILAYNIFHGRLNFPQAEFSEALCGTEPTKTWLPNTSP